MSNAYPPAVWMWSQACDLVDQAERLHRQFFRPTGAAQAFAVWEPPIDVFEDADEVVVVVAMPGAMADQVEVLHEPGLLTVRGVRPLPLRDGGQRVRQLEIPYGRFERLIPLPRRLDAGTPELVQGLLVVRLRKLGKEIR